MIRFCSAGAFVFVASLLLVACGGGGATPALCCPASTSTSELVRVTPPPRPTGVPETTRPIEQTTTLGSITPRVQNTPETTMLRKLIDASCQSNVATFRTSLETIYAALSCDSFWDERAKQLFVNKDVAVVLEVTRERYRLLFRTLDGVQGEFTVQGMWVQ